MDHHTLHLHHHLPDAFNPLQLVGFVSIMSFSFFASLHCATMCAPLVAAHLGPRASWKKAGLWRYNSARTLSYVAAGALLGTITPVTNSFYQPIGNILALILGLTLIFQAISLFGQNMSLPFRRFIPNMPSLVQTRTNSLVKRLRALPPHRQDIALGLVTVLLPCMTLTPALTAAAASGTTLNGAMIMLAFALGTWPTMLFASIVPNLIGMNGLGKRAQKIAAIFLLLAGIITILRITHSH